MSRIRILEVQYRGEDRRVDYRASLRLPGASISISATTGVIDTSTSPSSLHKIAQQHAAAMLRERSAGGYRLET
tara:strand:- start:3620 stop:3841 length:222 start_codon:yes stop_codon:yes gene_type:complete